jgi:cell division septum initiation protein DivIVA
LEWIEETISSVRLLQPQVEAQIEKGRDFAVLRATLVRLDKLLTDITEHHPDLVPDGMTARLDVIFSGPTDILADLRVALRKLDAVDRPDAEPPTPLMRELGRLQHDLLVALGTVIDWFMRRAPDSEHLASHFRDFASLQGLEAARSAQAESSALLADARRAADAVREVAGETSDTVLGEAFDTYARSERRAAEILRAAAIFVALAVVVGAAFVVLEGDFENLTVAEELGRVALTIPLAALAAYLARESSRHRRVARWARSIHVQLKTIDAYCESIDDSSLRASLRHEFGRRIFLSGEGPVDGDPDRSPDAPSVVGETGNLIQQITELARTASPGQR